MLLGKKSVLGASCHVIRQPGTRIHSGIQGISTLTIPETGTEKAGAVDKTIEKSSMRKGKNEEKGNQVQLALF